MSAGASRYRLVRTIASGGMAHVYEAVAQGERGFERRVAIKRVLPQYAQDESVRRMFFDEARIASRLHHANVVQVIDYGVVDGDDFIVMEYVDGVDAERAVSLARQRGERMPEPLALHVAAELAHALAYAHGLADEDGTPLGIVHRDVSPHNVLLSWQGDVKLSDFGIALSTRREEKTRTGVVKGKLAYMPPEQAAGRPVTGAADVYALGATLHALVANGPPADDPRHDLELDPTISEVARDLIATCMAREPDERPTAEAVARRAGSLAARTLERDARGALREWLAPLRASTGKVSALDDLMGLALVASGAGRRFTVSRDAPAPARRSDRPTAVATPAKQDPAEASVRLPTRRLPLAAAAALTATAIGVGAYVLTREPDPPAAVHATAPDTGTGTGTGTDTDTDTDRDTDTDTDTGTDTADGPRTTDAGSRITENGSRPTDDGSRRTDHVRRTADRGSRGTRPTAEPAADDAPRPAPDSDPPPAYLRIPRAGTTQERIEVDGSAAGFTPAVLRVPAGTHHVVVRRADTNDVVLERTVTAEPHHTRLAPLVLPR